MSAKSAKLLGHLRNTKAGWSDADIFKLMAAHGFLSREGNHTVYSHPDHPDLHLVVPSGKDLPKVYARQAEKLIDKLLDRQKKEVKGSGKGKP